LWGRVGGAETKGFNMSGPVVADRSADAPAAPLKVLIADDHPLMLAGLRRALERAERIEVVGEARSGPELLELIERRRPMLLLMDFRMPGLTGLECIEQIRLRWPEVKIVVLSMCDDRASIDSALRAGASAFIVKSVNPADVASVLRQVWGASTIFHSASRPQVVGQATAHETETPVLTKREQAILQAVVSGMTTAAISTELWVSEHTVKFHLTNIYRKLGVPNRAGAIRYALENGLVPTDTGVAAAA
jgi:two-component system nitrate/nitrite response regulator NarL